MLTAVTGRSGSQRLSHPAYQDHGGPDSSVVAFQLRLDLRRRRERVDTAGAPAVGLSVAFGPIDAALIDVTWDGWARCCRFGWPWVVGVGSGGGVRTGVADFDDIAVDVAVVSGPGGSLAADCVVREGGVGVVDVAVVDFDFVQRTFLRGFAVMMGFPAIFAGAGHAAERPVVARLSFAGDGDVRGGPEDAGGRIRDLGRGVSHGAGSGRRWRRWIREAGRLVRCVGRVAAKRDAPFGGGVAVEVDADDGMADAGEVGKVSDG